MEKQTGRTRNRERTMEEDEKENGIMIYQFVISRVAFRKKADDGLALYGSFLMPPCRLPLYQKVPLMGVADNMPYIKRKKDKKKLLKA